MTDRLPLTNAQLAFGLVAQRVGQRATVSLRFRAPACCLSAADLREVLQSVILINPALSHRIRFARGAAYQEWCPTDCDLVELHADSQDAASRYVADLTSEFKSDIDGAPVSARLIRSRNGDELVLIFDHALVDEQSLLLIKRQLAGPSRPDGHERTRYEAAVNNRVDIEDSVTAAEGPGMKFWGDRLRAAGGEFPAVRESSSWVVPFVTFPGVEIPSDFRGSLFPYVLYSLHRAVRDVAGGGSSVISYPWGGRNAISSDVVGCFMNTVVSLDTTRPHQPHDGMAAFLGRWFREIDHADVSFTALTGLGSGFSGAVTAMLSYTHAMETTVNIAGTEAVEVMSSHGSIPNASSFIAAAAVRDSELRLGLILDEQAVDYRVRELSARWRHWLGVVVSGCTEQRPRELSEPRRAGGSSQ